MRSAEVVAGLMTARVLIEQGPRVMSLAVDGLGEMFGTTQMTLEGPWGPVPLVGGHRLWTAPERRASTYVPDTGVRLVEDSDGVRVVSEDKRLIVEKAMRVRSVHDSLVVDHVLVNHSENLLELAGWALTMIRLGGIAVMPAPSESDEMDADLQARFAVIFWSYTDLEDSRLDVSHEGVSLRVEGTQPIKVGIPNLRGWMAYLTDGFAFIKWVEVQDPNQRYADLGAGIQCFVGHGFGELETLGPLRVLEPEASLTHREVWEIHRIDQQRPSVFESLDALNLPQRHPLLDLNP